MLKALSCSFTDNTLASVANLDEISDILNDPARLLWLDMHDPTEQERKKVAEEFDLHPLAIEYATHHHQRPKIEQYENFYFIVFIRSILIK